MAESLLASLYTRIKGSQEDVATLSLQYILSSSEKLNAAYNKLMSDSLKIEVESGIRYTCQSVGEDKERPDMSGVDSDGKEYILCEMKFYAGLTENQPNGYLKRLIDNGGKALVFVCPEARKASLWSKLIKLCEEQGRQLSGADEYRVIADGIAMSLVTWNTIIEKLRQVAASDVIEAKSDIDQLAGFCSMMDNTAFIPFSPEEMGAETARREERYYQVLDRLFDKLVANKELNASGKGLKSTARREGYARYIRVNEYCVGLLYNRQSWMNTSKEDTPFWFYCADDEWKQSDELIAKYRAIPEKQKDDFEGKIIIALYPMMHATVDEVADDLMKQIVEHLESVR